MRSWFGKKMEKEEEERSGVGRRKRRKRVEKIEGKGRRE